MTLIYQTLKTYILQLLITLNLLVTYLIKQKELVNKSDISNCVKKSELNIKLVTLATKAELKAEQEQMVKLQTYDLRYFPDKNFFGNESS